MKKITKRLFVGSDYTVEDYFEPYKEYCALNDLEINDPRYTIYHFLAEEKKNNLETLLSYFENHFKEEYFVITGELNLWNGKKRIVPVKVKSLSKAIDMCSNNADNISIYETNGHIEIWDFHHDGRNSFKIFALNDKGVNSLRGDLNKSYYHKKLKFM